MGQHAEGEADADREKRIPEGRACRRCGAGGRVGERVRRDGSQQQGADCDHRLRTHRHDDGHRGHGPERGHRHAHHCVRRRCRPPREHEGHRRGVLPSQDGPSQAGARLSQGAGRSRRGRRDDLHARPLARAHGRGGVSEGQGHLRAEADRLLHRGEPRHQGGRAAHEAHLLHRYAAAQREFLRQRLPLGNGLHQERTHREARAHRDGHH